MWRELFHGSPATALAVAAMLFFVAVFAGVLVWVADGRRTVHYQRMARLPVEDQEDER